MSGLEIGSAGQQRCVVALLKASTIPLVSVCVMLLAACSPAQSPGASATTWTGQMTVDPLTDATVTSAVSQVSDATGAFLAETTITCTATDDGAAFDVTAVFFDDQNVGAPVLVMDRGGPQDLAVLRVGDLEAVTLGLASLSPQYSNQLVVIGGRTGAQGSGDLQRYTMLAQLPDAERLVLKPTLTTGAPVFTVSMANAPAVRDVFVNCASVFQRYDQLAREAQDQIQVREEQAELYAPRAAATENQALVPPQREDFQQRAAHAEADCLQSHNVTADASDNPIRSMCAESGASWRQEFVNAARDYAFRVQTRHHQEFGQDRWAAEGRAAAACGRGYEAARRAANTAQAADAAADEAAACFIAAGESSPQL